MKAEQARRLNQRVVSILFVLVAAQISSADSAVGAGGYTVSPDHPRIFDIRAGLRERFYTGQSWSLLKYGYWE